jgi:hypothetical protein
MTDLFTTKLYNETKPYHTIVDKHPFVQLIRKNPQAAKLYIDFNKICIYTIQQTTNPFDKSLFSRLKRNINHNDIDFNISPNFKTLLQRCQQFPIEHSYMFYLGLMMGYKILDKYVKDDILSYNDSDIKLLIDDFKNFLNNTITSNNNQEQFINTVSQSYLFINQIFDEYQKQLI